MRLGSLFSGYGGLEQAVHATLGGETAWVSDIDPGACKILAHRYPDVPNLGDITKADWAAVEPVDVLTGGSPCQDLSHAGKRGGMTEGTRSNLWVAMREAIAQLRPGLVVWENVRGAYSAEADSDLEPCPRCVGDPRDRGPVLRALGRVLGDLSELGYVGGWHGLRAADVGAPHNRMRVFVVAHAQHAQLEGVGSLPGLWRGPDPRPDVPLLPTPDTGESLTGHGRRGGRVGNGRQSGASLDAIAHLLPTPAVNDMGEGKTPDAWDEWTATMQARHGNGNGHGKSLAIEAQRLLPTSTVEDRKASGGGCNGQTNVTLTDAAVRNPQDWGIYADAIARWEHLTRPAPAPTQPSKKGTPQLSARFSEWLMGLPAGWVTDVPGITRNEALKALGNGVVPQQAEAALRFLLAHIEGIAA